MPARTSGASQDTPLFERSIMKTIIYTRPARCITAVNSCVWIALFATATVDAGIASDAQLSAALLAARCPVANIEQAYKSDGISVFKVDCQRPAERRLVVTCTRTACSASVERNDDEDGS